MTWLDIWLFPMLVNVLCGPDVVVTNRCAQAYDFYPSTTVDLRDVGEMFNRWECAGGPSWSPTAATDLCDFADLANAYQPGDDCGVYHLTQEDPHG